MILYTYGPNTVILKDDINIIDINKFNLVVNKLLKDLKELDVNASTTRVRKLNEYVIIDGYGSIKYTKLKEFVIAYLNSNGFDYNEGTLDNQQSLILSPILSRINIRDNSQSGGTAKDTESIDVNVKDLSDVFNLYPGIETFSSCEGHLVNNSGTFYVLCTVDTIEHLNVFAFNIDNNLEIIMGKTPDLPMPYLQFSYGHWPNIRKVYFEIRIYYNKLKQQLVFDSMKELSILMKNIKEP